MNHATISIETLLVRFGPTISIRRSHGERESGWIIVSAAYKSGPDDEYVVKITDPAETMSKFVTIALIEAWNPSHK